MAGILQHAASSLFRGEGSRHSYMCAGGMWQQSAWTAVSWEKRTRSRQLKHCCSHADGQEENAALVAGTQVRVGCFEVCGKFCFDLLKSGEKLQVREDASGAVQASIVCLSHGTFRADLHI